MLFLLNKLRIWRVIDANQERSFFKDDFAQNVAIAHPGLNGTNAFPIFFAGLWVSLSLVTKLYIPPDFPDALVVCMLLLCCSPSMQLLTRLSLLNKLALGATNSHGEEGAWTTFTVDKAWQSRRLIGSCTRCFFFTKRCSSHNDHQGGVSLKECFFLPRKITNRKFAASWGGNLSFQKIPWHLSILPGSGIPPYFPPLEHPVIPSSSAISKRCVWETLHVADKKFPKTVLGNKIGTFRIKKTGTNIHNKWHLIGLLNAAAYTYHAINLPKIGR